MRIAKPTRWPRPTDFARGISLRYAVAAIVGSHLLAWVLIELLDLAGVVMPGAAGVVVVDLCLCAAFLPLLPRGVRARDLGLRRVPGARSAGLVLVALVAYFVSALFVARQIHTGNSHGAFWHVDRQSTLAIVLAGFGAFVSAPLVEELVWRGLLYRALRNRLPILPACVLAAVPFGAVHVQYSWGGRGIVAIFAVVVALLYEYTGSLLPGIALHSLIDGSGFVSAVSGNTLIAPGFFLLLALALVQHDVVRHLMRRAGRGKRPAPAET